MAEVGPSSISQTCKATDAPGAADDAQGVLISVAVLQKLFAWLSPSFPVGGFSYSHGLEWAIEDETVTNAESLHAWLADILCHGAGWSDAVLFHHAHRAAESGDSDEIAEINALAVASQPSRERHLESTAQGRAFLSTVIATWPSDGLARIAHRFPYEARIAYPVAVALASAAHAIPVEPAVNAYLAAFVSNLVSATVRALPLGQTDGQRVVSALSPLGEAVAHKSASASLDEIGGIAWRADIASMKHETQYTRLFRS